MTRIEKAVREVSDMRDFYRRIPKIRSRTKGRGTAKQPQEPARTSQREIPENEA